MRNLGIEGWIYV